MVSAVSANAYGRLMAKSNWPLPAEPVWEMSPILSINLWVDRPVLGGHAFVGTSERQIHWWFERRLAADRYHLIGVASGARALLERSKEEILTLASQELCDNFQAFKYATLHHALVNKEREATVSLTPDAERRRPAQWTASPHIYRVGDWTHTDLPATLESAVVSARRCVDKISAIFTV